MPNAGAMGEVPAVGGPERRGLPPSLGLQPCAMRESSLFARVQRHYSLSLSAIARLLYSCKSHISFQVSPVFNSRPGSWQSLSTCPTDSYKIVLAPHLSPVLPPSYFSSPWVQSQKRRCHPCFILLHICLPWLLFLKETESRICRPKTCCFGIGLF